jgi:metal-dependent hydrolase (beta-lactamase superfamily II)
MLMLINLVKVLLVMFDLVVVVPQARMIDVNAKDLVMQLLQHHHYDHLYLIVEQE